MHGPGRAGIELVIRKFHRSDGQVCLPCVRRRQYCTTVVKLDAYEWLQYKHGRSINELCIEVQHQVDMREDCCTRAEPPDLGAAQ